MPLCSDSEGFYETKRYCQKTANMTQMHTKMYQGNVSALVGTYLWFAMAPDRPNFEVMIDAVRTPKR